MKDSLTQKELKDIIQWDINNWAKCLDFWSDKTSLKKEHKVLALGEREGGLSLYFALKGHEVICSDYHALPDTTKKMHQDYNVSERISYQSIDMKSIDIPNESIDVVVFKSVLGALGNAEDQEKAMQEIYRVLKKDGVFIFAENLEGSKLHQFLRKKFVKWGERWRYVKMKEMKDWNNPYKAVYFKSFGVISLFGRSENQRKFLSSIDRIITPITPKKWRYILFGVLKK